MNSEPERTFDRGRSMEAGDGMEFERELTEALRPVSVPAGLADRIVAAAQVESVPPQPKLRPQPKRGGPIPFPVRRWVGGAAIAAALIGGVFATEDVRQNRARARQRALATQEFEAATRITDGVLQQTREQLQRAGALPFE